MGKTYKVHEDGGRVVGVEVDGVWYATPDDIPDPVDRERVRLLIGEPPAAVEAPTRSPFPIERVVAGVFAAVAAVLLAVAVVTGVSTGRAIAREQVAPGRVADLVARTAEVPRESTGRNGRRETVLQEFFYPVVEFELPDGTRKTVQTSEGSWPPAYEKGEAVTVRYDPDKPTRARIASSAGNLLMWVWTLITGVLGLAFAAATALIYRAFIRTPRRGQTPAKARPV